MPMEPSPSPRRPFTASMFLLGATTALTAVMIETANAQTSVSTSSSSATVSAQAVNFDIPAGKLSSALVAFSTQAHVPLSSQTPTLAGKMFSGLRGQFTPSAALSHILSGSGLSYRVVGNNAFQVVPASNATNITLGPVRVGGTITQQDPTGPGVGYVATNTMSGTKTDTPITEIPNSIYVVTKQLMQDQQPQNVQQALRYTPGVYAETYGTGGNGAAYGAQSGITQRGFNSTQFVDGLMTYSASAGETAFLERIEAVNGPASVMYGQVNPGGMIAMDLKKPTETPLHQVSLGFGNWGRYEATFDVSDKITKSGDVRYRVAGIGVTQGTQTNYLDYHRVGIMPSITWDINRKTSLTLLGMYMYTPGDGVSEGYPLTGTLLSNGYPKISRSLFIGIPGLNKNSQKDAMFEYQFKHEFNKYVNFSQVYRWEQSYYDVKSSYYSYAPSDSEVEVGPWVRQQQNTTSALDTRIFGKIDTGPLKHTWVVGSDFRTFNMPEYLAYDFGSTDIINIYNPHSSYGSMEYCFDYKNPNCNVNVSNRKNNWFQEGVYFQDQIKWKNISILIGGRQDWVNYNYSRVRYSTAGNIVTNGAPQPQSAFTWRAGIIYKFDFGLSPYFSYSTSFVPQIGSTDYLGNAFAPLTGKQLEAGLKYKIPGRDVLLTASAFRINEDHYLIDDLVHTGYSTDGGRVRSQGFEVSANANISRDLKVVASYSYTDMRFAKTNQTAQRFDPYTGSNYGGAVSESGMSVLYVPRNMFSVFADYTLPRNIMRGFGLNWGMRYVGSTYIDNVESFKTPDYILFDVGAHYDFGESSPILKGLKAQLAISNLTNKYYVTACGTTECYLGQGRRVYGNLTYNW